MPEHISQDLVMRYLDGEASPDERGLVESHLETFTELQRDLAVFRSMKEELAGIRFDRTVRKTSVWDQVARKLTQPIGWILLVIGTVIWMAYGGYLYFASDAEAVEKMATGAIVIGIIMLLTSVIWEQYRAWLIDPYKGIQR